MILNYEMVPVAELDKASLPRERAQLLDRHFEVGLTEPEQVRLTWIRWQLDRLDAAMMEKD